MLNTVTTGRLLALMILALVVYAPWAAEGPSCRTWRAEWLGSIITFGMLGIAGIILADWVFDMFVKKAERP